MKRYLVECIGTFFLTMAVVFTSNPLAIGLMLMAILYAGAHVSGGHFNPAVSLAMLIRGKLSTATAAIYCIAQSIGACAATCLFTIFAKRAANVIATDFVWWQVFVIEALPTFIFCSVILAVTTGVRFKVAELAPLVIGLTLVGLASFTGVYNPAIVVGSLCSMLLKSSTLISAHAIYRLLFPLLGGAAAACVHYCLND